MKFKSIFTICVCFPSGGLVLCLVSFWSRDQKLTILLGFCIVLIRKNSAKSNGNKNKYYYKTNPAGNLFFWGLFLNLIKIILLILFLQIFHNFIYVFYRRHRRHFCRRFFESLYSIPPVPECRAEYPRDMAHSYASQPELQKRRPFDELNLKDVLFFLFLLGTLFFPWFFLLQLWRYRPSPSFLSPGVIRLTQFCPLLLPFSREIALVLFFPLAQPRECAFPER